MNRTQAQLSKALSTQVDLDLKTGCFSPEGRCSDQGGTGTLGDSLELKRVPQRTSDVKEEWDLGNKIRGEVWYDGEGTASAKAWE